MVIPPVRNPDENAIRAIAVVSMVGSLHHTPGDVTSRYITVIKHHVVNLGSNPPTLRILTLQRVDIVEKCE